MALNILQDAKIILFFSSEKRQIEQVQRNAARFVSNKPFNYQNPISATSMIQQLNWPTLDA